MHRTLNVSTTLLRLSSSLRSVSVRDCIATLTRASSADTQAIHTHSDTSISICVSKLLGTELDRDARHLKRGKRGTLTRPRAEPVDGAAVDQAREHAQPGAELLSHGGHRHHHVDVLSHSDEVLAVTRKRVRGGRNRGQEAKNPRHCALVQSPYPLHHHQTKRKPTFSPPPPTPAGVTKGQPALLGDLKE